MLHATWRSDAMLNVLGHRDQLVRLRSRGSAKEVRRPWQDKLLLSRDGCRAVAKQRNPTLHRDDGNHRYLSGYCTGATNLANLPETSVDVQRDPGSNQTSRA